MGSLQVSLENESLTKFESDKVRALLAYLAVESGRPHRREKLASIFWPEMPERSARTNLRRALANLRQVIDDQTADPPFLSISRQTIQFNQHNDSWVDVVAFNDLTKDKKSSPQNSKDLEKAAALYQGEFLEGFSLPDSVQFEEWLIVTREGLFNTVIQTHHRLAEQYLHDNNHTEAIRHASRQIELDSYQEAAHQQMIWLLAVSAAKP